MGYFTDERWCVGEAHNLITVSSILASVTLEKIMEFYSGVFCGIVGTVIIEMISVLLLLHMGILRIESSRIEEDDED